MRYLAYLAPLVLLFACGKLATKRSDGKATATETSSSTTTETATGTEVTPTVVGDDDPCVKMTKISDQDAADKFIAAKCAEKAQFCSTDEQCTTVAAICGGTRGVNKLLAEAVAAYNQRAGQAVDCALRPQIPEGEFRPYCDAGYCSLRVTMQAKAGTTADCDLSGKPDTSKDPAACRADYLCKGVYFDHVVDVRTYAEADATKCTGKPLDSQFCYKAVAGNTATPQPDAYAWMTPAVACQMYESSAAQ